MIRTSRRQFLQASAALVVWMADHATAPVAVTPILVMDMYEHAYQMDYGAATARYIDAFFANIQWDVVSRRLEQAEMLSRESRG